MSTQRTLCAVSVLVFNRKPVTNRPEVAELRFWRQRDAAGDGACHFGATERQGEALAFSGESFEDTLFEKTTPIRVHKTTTANMMKPDRLQQWRARREAVFAHSPRRDLAG